MAPYERLDAWQMAHRMALLTYKVTESWPVAERFGLTIQVRRAALSIPTNIAEGVAKRGTGIQEVSRYRPGVIVGADLPPTV
jgi:four helix bundle protein